MPNFRAGRYTEILVSGVALSTYVDSVDISRDVDMMETTTFTATGKTYVAGLPDSKVDIKGKYDPAAAGPVALLQTLVGAPNTVPVVIYPGGNTTGQRKEYFDGLLNSYNESSEVGGIVSFDASFTANGPILASGI